MCFLGIQLGVGNHGGGTHQWNLSYDKVQYNWLVSIPNSLCILLSPHKTHLQYANYGDIVYSISLAATKISIMLLILRIFLSVQRDALWWLTQCLIAVNTVFYTIYIFVPIFLCRPRRKIYNPDEPGHCLKIFDLYMASASFNMVSDIAMLSVRRKMGVSLIFGTGSL